MKTQKTVRKSIVNVDRVKVNRISESSRLKSTGLDWFKVKPGQRFGLGSRTGLGLYAFGL